MKVVGFIGTGRYQTTTYVHDGRECQTAYFPVAVCAFYRPSALVLLTTAAAREMHLDPLEADLRRCADVPLTAVPIPDGTSEVELWQLFDAIVEHVMPGEDVVLDLTHGYRSLPMLALIAAAYLRVAKNVRIERLLYGAWEARTADGPEGRSPVFDLTSFLALLEWTAAADLFRRTGNAEPLADLLRQIQNTLHRTGGGQSGLPTRLKPAAEALGRVSESLRLIRVHEAMQAAHDLTTRLEHARADTAAWARPFAVLIDELRQAYRPLALGHSDGEPLHDLEVQLAMIRWYVDKGWGAEAVALAREWIVSLEALRSGLDLMGKWEREAVERALGDALAARKQHEEKVGGPESIEPLPIACEPLTVSVDLWSELADLRNDIAHAGMRRAPRPARSISRNIADLHGRLEPLLDDLRGQDGGGG